MATSAKPSFDAIIQEGRKKKKNEKLAERIFRRGSTPQANARSRNQSPSTSLASRVGVQKRPQNSRQSSSQASLRSSQNTRKANLSTRKSEQIRSAVVENHGISIKGMGSGSCVVVAQNFAPGTSAGDIEAVMAPLGDQSISSCRLIASNPTVIAELVFLSKELALDVVERFNNKMADGHRLYVYIQQNSISPQPITTSKTAQPAPVVQEANEVQEPVQEVEQQTYNDNSMEVDEGQTDGTYQNNNYQQTAPPTQPRRAAPSYEDGRYGFGEQSYGDARNGRREDGGGYRDGNRGYDNRRYDDRGYQGGRGQGYNSQYRGYRQDYGGRGGQGRLASDNIMGRR